jgi:cytochrome P450
MGITVEHPEQVFVTPEAYTDERALRAVFARLRRDDPVARVVSEQYDPFWAVTKYDDVMEVGARADVFRNAPRPTPVPRTVDAERAARKQSRLRTLIHLDDPTHHRYRVLTAEWFLPRTVNRYEPRIAELASRFVDELEAAGEADFVETLAVQVPLHTIMAILGLPHDDRDRVLALTQRILAPNDREHQRGSQAESYVDAFTEFGDYFRELVAHRREHPTDDLLSMIAHARLDGELLDDVDIVSYCIIIGSAGHDTTASALAGGMLAMIEHPDQLARLQQHPDLINPATEEIIRWTTPTKCFMRTAAQDYELRGRQIDAGDWVMLSFASANFDEDKFVDPERFDIGRSPNKHLAFGWGPHFCLGAQLARLEVRTVFAEIARRGLRIELIGTPEFKPTVFVGGVKHLPVHVVSDTT